MTTEEIKRLADARPFQPFLIRVADNGDPLKVPTADHISIGKGPIIVVWFDDGTGSFVDSRLITRLETATTW